MKKILFGLTGFIFAVSVFFNYPALAALGVKDQANETYSSGWYQGLSALNYGQTFKPTKNRISRLNVYLRSEVKGYGCTLTVKNEVTGDVITTSFKRLDGIDGWESFDFDYDPIVVTPEKEYGIYVTSESPVAWSRSNSDAYARGNMMFFGSDKATDDFMFIQEGFDYVAPAEPGDPAEEPVTEDAEEEKPASDAEKVEKTTEQDEKELNQDLAAPLLTEVVKNKKSVNFTDSASVKFTESDVITLRGKAEPEAKVVIYLDEEQELIYSVDSNEEGLWEFVVPVNELEGSQYNLIAQVEKDEEASEKVELLALERGSEAVVAESAEATPWYMTWGIYHTIGLVLLLVLLALLVAYLVILRLKAKGKLKSKEIFKKK